MMRQPISAVLLLLVSLVAYAQDERALPQFNQGALDALLRKESLQRSLADLKLADSRRLEIVRNLGFEDGDMCVAPPPVTATDIDVHRSLFVHDTATLHAGDFSLRRTLQKLTDDVAGSIATTPEQVFQQLWDTQNDTVNAVNASGIHCDVDDGKINGFPLNKCPRPEGKEATPPLIDIANRIDNEYKVIGLVNRIDLAHQGWRNCGEHRIIYGKRDGIEANFIIFEAVLPNPRPGCRSGCRDVIEFWLDLSNDSDPSSRAGKLENFYFNGLAGFRPVVHTQHYSASGVGGYGGSGSGQIRSNQFLNRAGIGLGPWTLKEFKTVLTCAGGACDFALVPITVKNNPYGVLWSRDVANGGAPMPPPSNPTATPIVDLATLAQDFQADVLAQVTSGLLGNPDINRITYAVDKLMNAGESQSLSPTIDHYLDQFNSSSDATFRNDLQTVAGGFMLTGTQVVNRATAQSCAGCHLPSAFQLSSPNAIGPGMDWPDALSFVHNDVQTVAFGAAQGFDPIHFANDPTVFNISPALLDVFLPDRRNNLTTEANMDVCNCELKLFRFELSAAALERFKQDLKRQQTKTVRRLNEVGEQLNRLDRVSNENLTAALELQEAILAEATEQEIKLLAEHGVKPEEVQLGAVPDVVLRESAKDPRAFIAQRQRELQQLLEKEPPRRTVEGTFRVH